MDAFGLFTKLNSSGNDWPLNTSRLWFSLSFMFRPFMSK